MIFWTQIFNLLDHSPLFFELYFASLSRELQGINTCFRWNCQWGSSKQAKRRHVPKLPIPSTKWCLLQDVLGTEVYMAWKSDTLVTIKYRNTTSDWKISWTLKDRLVLLRNITSLLACSCSFLWVFITGCRVLLYVVIIQYDLSTQRFCILMLHLFHEIQRHSPLAQSLNQHNPVTSGGHFLPPLL